MSPDLWMFQHGTLNQAGQPKGQGNRDHLRGLVRGGRKRLGTKRQLCSEGQRQRKGFRAPLLVRGVEAGHRLGPVGQVDSVDKG